MVYCIYKTDTGRVVKRFSGPASMIDAQLGEGEAYLEADCDPRLDHVDLSGDPVIVADAVKADVAQISAIKAEAARRIEVVAPLWKQANFLREGGAEADTAFALIDAIRAHSDTLEADLAAGVAVDLVNGWP